MAIGDTTDTGFALSTIFERLSKDARQHLTGGYLPEEEDPVRRVVTRLAREGLTRDEAVALSLSVAGPWRRAKNSLITDEQFAAEIETVSRESDFDTIYREDREKFHDIPAGVAMSEVVYPAGAPSASGDPTTAWNNQEEAAQEIANAAGVSIQQEAAPAKVAEAEARLGERGQKLVEKVSDATVRVPRDRNFFDRDAVNQFAAIQSQVRQREAQAVATMLGRDQRDHVRIADGAVWASLIVSERAAREYKAERPRRMDLDEETRKAHEAAVLSSKLSQSSIRWLAVGMKAKESFKEALARGDGRYHRTALSYHQIAAKIVARELHRYDIALAKVGVSYERRKEMVVREATIRAAEYGIGLDAAQKGFDGRLRGYQASVARAERRLARQAEQVDRQMSRAPARNLSDLSPAQLEAHREASLAALRVGKVQSLKQVEEHRAYRSAESGEPAMEARGRTKLTRVEAAQVLIASGMHAYEASLRRSGLDDTTVSDMVARERQHRENAVGLKPDHYAGRAVVSQSQSHAGQQERPSGSLVETEVQMSIRYAARIDALAAEIAQRGDVAVDLSSLNLSDRERQIHEQALAASRIEASHVAGMIRNEEVDRARTQLGDRDHKSNRDFFKAWGENALSKEDASRLIHAAELQGYSNHLKAAGLSDERVERLVGYEDEARRRHLGLPSFVNDTRAGQQQLESARDHFDRFERLADASSSTSIGDEPQDSLRMSREEIQSLAGELEFAAREAYARDHNVTLGEAAAIVKISPEEVRAGVVDIERDRLEALSEQEQMIEDDRQIEAELLAEQQAAEARRTAAENDATDRATKRERARERRQEILDRPSDHASRAGILKWDDVSHATLTLWNSDLQAAFEHRVADQNIKRARFAELAIIQKEMDPVHDAKQLRQSRHQARELFDYMKANGIEPQGGAAKDLFDRIDNEMKRQAEHKRDRSAGMSMSM